MAQMHDQIGATIEIRRARPGDQQALTRLAQRDTARVPPAPLLLAYEDAELRAAISLATGAVIADPFAPTARLVALLRTHAAPARRRARPSLRPRIRPRALELPSSL
jgi:hypothetical protein